MSYSYYSNPPKRRKSRKRRTAAQKRATARLVRLNRERARYGGGGGRHRAAPRFVPMGRGRALPPSRIPVALTPGMSGRFGGFGPVGGDGYAFSPGSYSNPRRRKKVRKSRKHRTAAQKAATKRLIAWNKRHRRGKGRRNPLYLGKQTAVGTRLTGRMIRAKGRRRRLSRGRVDSWRMQNVLGRHYTVPRGFSRKAHRRGRKHRTAAQKRATKQLIAFNRRRAGRRR